LRACFLVREGKRREKRARVSDKERRKETRARRKKERINKPEVSGRVERKTRRLLGEEVPEDATYIGSFSGLRGRG